MRITRGGAVAASFRMSTALATAVLLLNGAALDAAPRKKAAPEPPPVQRKGLLVFPVEVVGANVPNAADIAGSAMNTVMSRFQLAKVYIVTEFLRGYPPIARLLAEQELSTADVTPPFVDENRKVTKVARLIGYELAFVGAVSDYQNNVEKKQLSITVSGVLLETTRDAVGFRIVKSAVGSATEAVGAAGETAAALAASRAAADQLMTELLRKPPPSEPAKPAPAKTGSS